MELRGPHLLNILSLLLTFKAEVASPEQGADQRLPPRPHPPSPTPSLQETGSEPLPPPAPRVVRQHCCDETQSFHS